MKKMKSLMAMFVLVGVLGVSQAFATGVIVPSNKPPRPVSGYSVSGLFADVYDYFAGLFTADEEGQTNDSGIIMPTFTPTKPKPTGVIVPMVTNDVGIIHTRP